MAVDEAKLDNLPAAVAESGVHRFCRAAQAPCSLVCQARP